MKTFKRICLKNIKYQDRYGQVLELVRGNEYITSAEDDGTGTITVFTKFWADISVELFAGEEEFTGGG